MRLTVGKDPDLQSNLRILQLCSKVKTIKLLNTIRKLEKQQENLLTNPDNSELRFFLDQVSSSEDIKNGRRPKDMYTT